MKLIERKIIAMPITMRTMPEITVRGGTQRNGTKDCWLCGGFHSSGARRFQRAF